MTNGLLREYFSHLYLPFSPLSSLLISKAKHSCQLVAMAVFHSSQLVQGM